MDTALQIGKILLALAIGIGASIWQVVEYREKFGWTIIWLGIIPVPVGVVGLVGIFAGIVMTVQLFNPTHQ